VEHINGKIIVLRDTVKADSPKFYLYIFCLLYGLDASLDLPLMLLASKLPRYKRSLPLSFFPLAVWWFEAALCFQSVTSLCSFAYNIAIQVLSTLCSSHIYENVVRVVDKMFIDSVIECCYLTCNFKSPLFRALSGGEYPAKFKMSEIQDRKRIKVKYRIHCENCN